MTKLEDLLYSLATVLIRYHDSQSGVRKIVDSPHQLLRKMSRSSAIAMLQVKEYKKCFEELITECTRGYPGRKPFLHFILHEIIFLKTQLDKQKSFDSASLDDYQNQLTQLFIDFRQLLSTTKGKTYEVKHSTLFVVGESQTIPSTSLSGLINDSYTSIGNSFCNSGVLLKEEVLDTLNIAVTHSDSELNGVAKSLCAEHQNALLVPELLKDLKLSRELQLEQKNTIDSLQDQLQRVEEQRVLLTAEKKQQCEQIAGLVEDNSALTKRIITAETQLADRSKAVENIRSQMNEIPAAASTGGRNPYPFRGAFFGLAGFSAFAPNMSPQGQEQRLALDDPSLSELPGLE